MPTSRAFTVTTTKDRQKSVCAITMVMKPSTLSNPTDTNMASSDEPITTSGVAIGRKITRFEADRPRNEWRTRANAISVPSNVASRVAVMATPKLSWRDSHSPSGSQIDVQLPQVNDSNSAVAERPDGWLNDSAKM